MKPSPLKFIQESRANAQHRTRRIVTVTITIVVIIAKERIVATFEYRVARSNKISVGRQYSTYVLNLYFFSFYFILLDILLLCFIFFRCLFKIQRADLKSRANAQHRTTRIVTATITIADTRAKERTAATPEYRVARSNKTSVGRVFPVFGF